MKPLKNQNRCYQCFNSVPPLSLPETMICAFPDCLLHLSTHTFFFSFQCKKSKHHPGILKKIDINFRQNPLRVNVGWTQPTDYTGQQAGRNWVGTLRPPWKCSRPSVLLVSPGSPGSWQSGADAGAEHTAAGLAHRAASHYNLLLQNHTQPTRRWRLEVSGQAGSAASIECHADASKPHTEQPRALGNGGASFLPGIDCMTAGTGNLS